MIILNRGMIILCFRMIVLNRNMKKPSLLLAFIFPFGLFISPYKEEFLP